jgi:hypothetical protein
MVPAGAWRYWSETMLTRSGFPPLLSAIERLDKGLYDRDLSEDKQAALTQAVVRRLAVEFGDDVPVGLRPQLNGLYNFLRPRWKRGLFIEAELPRVRDDEIHPFLVEVMASLRQETERVEEGERPGEADALEDEDISILTVLANNSRRYLSPQRIARELRRLALADKHVVALGENNISARLKHLAARRLVSLPPRRKQKGGWCITPEGKQALGEARTPVSKS